MPAPIRIVDILVEAGNSLNQRDSEVAGLVNGGFVVAYTSPFGSESNLEVIATRFNASNLTGIVIAGGVAGEQVQGDVAGLVDGRIGLVEIDQQNIVVRLFNNDGAGLFAGGRGTIAGTGSLEFRPQIAALPSGNFLASWMVGAEVRVRQFDISGTALGPDQVASTSALTSDVFHGDMVTLANGTVVVGFLSASGIPQVRIFDPVSNTFTGQAQSLPLADPQTVSVAASATGGFVAVTRSAGTPGFGLFGTYSADGAFQRGVQFSTEGLASATFRAVGLPDGRSMVVWSSTNANGSEVWGRMFLTNGDPDGVAFRVNSNTAGDAYDPSISLLADGRVAVSYTSTANGDEDVYAAVFDPRETGLFLTGTSFADEWVGSNYGDALFGGLGNDTLFGAAGADTLAGESGNDFLFGGDTGDFLYGGAGADALVGEEGDDFLLGEVGDDNLSGGIGNDNLLGGDGGDTLNGGDGNDGLFGENGDDFIDGGIGADTAFGGAGNDQMFGGSGNDTLRGETGNDTINAGADDDTVLGGDGDDLIIGGGGADTLFGELGIDQILGGIGNDVILGGNDGDTLNGNENDDQLFGEGGGDDIRGGDGNDLLQGGGGNDFMFGDADSDTLHGSFGSDDYTGGAGSDIFAFVRSEMGNGEVDQVLDWNAVDDSIQIFGATAANISTAVVGPDVLIAVSLAGGGTANIFIRGTTDNVAVFNDIQFI